MPDLKDKDMNRDKNQDDGQDQDKDKDKLDSASKTYLDSIKRDRDRAKKKLKELENKLKEYETKVSSFPPEDELKTLQQELEDLRKYKQQVEEKQKEAELKDKSESERLKIQLESIREEYESKLKEVESKVQQTESTYQQELQKREALLNKLYDEVLEARIRKVALEKKAYSPDQIVLMTKHFFQKNDEGEFYALNKKGREVTVEEFVLEFLEDPKNKNLIAIDLPNTGDDRFKRTHKKKSSEEEDKIDVSEATDTDRMMARVGDMSLETAIKIRKIKEKFLEAKKKRTQQAGG